jgi:hypothetical protein
MKIQFFLDVTMCVVGFSTFAVISSSGLGSSRRELGLPYSEGTGTMIL